MVEEFGLVFDMRQKAQGRGAYAHATAACLTDALNGGFARSFKQAVPKNDNEAFIASVSEAIRTRLDEHIRVAMRAGRVAIGGTNLEVAMRENDVDVIFIASNCGSATDKKFRSNADRKGIQVLDGLSGEELAKPMGKSYLSVLGINASSAFSVSRDWAALNKLGFFDSGVEQPPEHR